MLITRGVEKTEEQQPSRGMTDIFPSSTLIGSVGKSHDCFLVTQYFQYKHTEYNSAGMSEMLLLFPPCLKHVCKQNWLHDTFRRGKNIDVGPKQCAQMRKRMNCNNILIPYSDITRLIQVASSCTVTRVTRSRGFRLLRLCELLLG